MKVVTLGLLMLSLNALANNGTCSKGTTLHYQCFDSDNVQYDFCKKANLPLYVIKTNGEVYATHAERDDMEKVIEVIGTNYAEESFIATITKNKNNTKNLEGTLAVYFNDRLMDSTQLKCSIRN